MDLFFAEEAGADQQLPACCQQQKSSAVFPAIGSGADPQQVGNFWSQIQPFGCKKNLGLMIMMADVTRGIKRLWNLWKYQTDCETNSAMDISIKYPMLIYFAGPDKSWFGYCNTVCMPTSEGAGILHWICLGKCGRGDPGIANSGKHETSRCWPSTGDLWQTKNWFVGPMMSM